MKFFIVLAAWLSVANAAEPVIIVGGKQCSVCYVHKVTRKNGKWTIRMLGDNCFKPKMKGQCKLLKPKGEK